MSWHTFKIKQSIHSPSVKSPLSWSCRIRWLHLCRGIILLPQVSFLDITQNNLALKRYFWIFGVLSFLPDPERLYLLVLSIGQIELSSWVWHETASDGEVWVLHLWRIWNTPSFPVLPDSPELGVEVPVTVPSMGQMELFNHFTLYIKWLMINRIVKSFKCVLTNNFYEIELFVLDRNTWNNLILCKILINCK